MHFHHASQLCTSCPSSADSLKIPQNPTIPEPRSDRLVLRDSQFSGISFTFAFPERLDLVGSGDKKFCLSIGPARLHTHVLFIPYGLVIKRDKAEEDSTIAYGAKAEWEELYNRDSEESRSSEREREFNRPRFNLKWVSHNLFHSIGAKLNFPG